MTDIAALIERLEKAGGPSRDIDAEIHCRVVDTRYTLYGALNDGCPFYTGSIDCALTLLPDGHYITLQEGTFGAAWSAFIGKHGSLKPVYQTQGIRTPAIALCIACLRARSAI